MVLKEAPEIIDINEQRIRRTKDRNIVTKEEVKQFKITGPKRKLDEGNDTLPFGFKKPRLE